MLARNSEITAAEAARRCNVEESTFRRWLRRGLHVPPHHGRPTTLSTQIESNVVKTVEFYFYQGYALSKGTVITMARRIYNSACLANLISPSQKPPSFSFMWFAGFARRHNLSQRLVESISDDRKAASTPDNAESLFNKISHVIELQVWHRAMSSLRMKLEDD